MSVWQSLSSLPVSVPSLSSAEGDLVSVSVPVEPHRLEALLESLAEASFPINPQIYHDTVTLVEFPAYGGQLDEVRATLSAHGFDAAGLRYTAMLAKIQAASA
ncbi:MAG: hypothetical protein ACLQVN_02755 [Bryobacteraceae bacterium]